LYAGFTNNPKSVGKQFLQIILGKPNAETLEKGGEHLSTEDVRMYWDIKEVLQIRPWLLRCVEECIP
jgi:hypothetical protein